MSDDCRRPDNSLLGSSGLAIKPQKDLSSPVTDGPSDPKASRSSSEVPPVAKGCDRHAHDVRDLLQRQQFVTGVRR